jgi:putative Mg2+ transporter-C (MgtC) family protein
MSDLEIVVKLLIACFFGGIIGYLREKEKKSAGLRTHIIVCMGAALFTIVSIYMTRFGGAVDPSRIASTVVMGIGFIGGGAIMREGGSVRGLTTASSIWVVAAIGIAIGVGLYVGAITATILAVLVLQTLSVVERKVMASKKFDIE